MGGEKKKRIEMRVRNRLGGGKLKSKVGLGPVLPIDEWVEVESAYLDLRDFQSLPPLPSKPSLSHYQVNPPTYPIHRLVISPTERPQTPVPPSPKAKKPLGLPIHTRKTHVAKTLSNLSVSLIASSPGGPGLNFGLHNAGRSTLGTSIP